MKKKALASKQQHLKQKQQLKKKRSYRSGESGEPNDTPAEAEMIVQNISPEKPLRPAEQIYLEDP